MSKGRQQRRDGWMEWHCNWVNKTEERKRVEWKIINKMREMELFCVENTEEMEDHLAESDI